MTKSKKKKIFVGCLSITLVFLAIIATAGYILNGKLTEASKQVEKLIQDSEKTTEERSDSNKRPQISDLDRNEPNANIEVKEIEKYPNKKEISQIEQTVWIPTWDFNEGLKSLQEKNGRFYSISPVWYSVNGDGTLVDRRDSRWREVVNASGTAQILPSIAFSDADILHQILSNDSSYTTHINSIMTQVIQYDYDGIDLDYEIIYEEDKSQFRSFVEDLALKLHQNDKILSVTVLPQWGDEVIYTSRPETRSVQNYEWVGNVADEVRIMTYDFTALGSDEPGPIAPITWMESVISYATEKIDRDKLWLGIHLYGYQWDSGGRGRATTFSQIPDFEKIPDYKYLYNSSYAEGIASYTCTSGIICTHFFQTVEGVEARKELAANYGIKGVAYWRLGREGDLL